MPGVRLPSQVHGGVRGDQPQRGRAARRHPHADPPQGGAPEGDRRGTGRPERGVRQSGLVLVVDTQQRPGEGEHEGEGHVHVALRQGRRPVRQLRELSGALTSPGDRPCGETLVRTR